MDQQTEQCFKEFYAFLQDLDKVAIPGELRNRGNKLKDNITKKFPALLQSDEDEGVYDPIGEVVDLANSDTQSDSSRQSQATQSKSVASRFSTRKKDSSALTLSDETVALECSAPSLVNFTFKGWLEKRRPDMGLNKLASMVSSHQKRFGVISDGVFYYFINEESNKPKGSFLLKDYEVRLSPAAVKDSNKQPLSFELIKLGDRSYSFVAPDKDGLRSWIEAVDKHTDHHHDIDIILNNDSNLKTAPPVGKRPDTPSVIEEEPYDEGSVAESTPISKAAKSAAKPSPKPPVHAPPSIPDEDVYDVADEENRPTSVKAGKSVPSPPSSTGRSDRGALPAIPSDTPEEIYDEAELEKTSPRSDEPLEDIYDEASEDVERKSSVKSIVTAIKPNVKKTSAPSVSEENVYDEGDVSENIYDEGDVESTAPKPSILNRSLPLVPPTAAEKIEISPTNYANMYYGLWDCTGIRDHELSFTAGEIIHIVGRKYETDGWLTCYLDGKVGLVPKSFLSPAYELCA